MQENKTQEKSSEESIIRTLQQGGVIAYPTEGVYGLGCDPFNEAAVERLCALKKRSIDKGLILIAACWADIEYLTQPIPSERLATIQATWPGPTTWVFPASSAAPRQICGKHASIALRVTANPTAHRLCKQFNGPIVSTSANPSNSTPARDAITVKAYFGDALDGLIDAPLGDTQHNVLAGPTPLYDGLTGKPLRI